MMNKGISFVWDSACQEAFEKIKSYLTHPLVSGKPFLIYVRAMDYSWALY